jgi:hypothetical protein
MPRRRTTCCPTCGHKIRGRVGALSKEQKEIITGEAALLIAILAARFEKPNAPIIKHLSDAFKIQQSDSKKQQKEQS